MAPVLSFTAEEIWGFMPKGAGGEGQDIEPESVFLAEFPVVDERFIDEAMESRWEKLIAVRNEVNKALEIKRQDRFIGNALEAKVTIFAGEEYYRMLNGYREFLPALFIVSDAEIRNSPPEGDVVESPDLKGVSISVERAPGDKCERCWNWSTEVNTLPDAPGLCRKCYNNLK